MLPIFTTIEDPKDRDLFDRAYRAHSRFLIGTANRILHDWAEAEDAVQDVFVRLMDAPQLLRRVPEEEQRVFLVVCTRNRARDILKKKNRIPELELREEITETAVSPEEESGPAARLKEEMAKLPAGQREILELHFFWGMKFDEIGKLTDKSPGAVQRMANRLVKDLKKRLEGGAI